MIAGIPGTGIGGLFYLLIALWMPVRELYLTVRRRARPAQSGFVRRQSLISLSLIAGTWATGELLGVLLHRLGVIATTHLLHRLPVLVTLAILIAVYLGVHLVRMSVRHPVTDRPQTRTPMPSQSPTSD